MTAIGIGAVMLATRKGTRRHRLLGRVFLGCMLIVNVAALAIYNIDGGWTVFHWLAVASLALLAGGMIPLWLRRPQGNWMVLHSSLMTGAYIGLVTAGIAQVAGYLTAAQGSWGVWPAIVVVFAVGGMLSARYIPQTVENSAGRGATSHPSSR